MESEGCSTEGPRGNAAAGNGRGLLGTWLALLKPSYARTLVLSFDGWLAMQRRFALIGLSVVALVATIVVAACSTKNNQQCAAPSSHPAFHLTVRAPGGKPLPAQLVLTIKYGSGEEIYDAEHPNQTPQVVFCKQVQEGGSPEGGAADASNNAEEIVCDLWTDGAANVKIEAEGYPKMERDLSAEVDECGLKLTEATITLQEGD
jgi:hypothetical protein